MQGAALAANPLLQLVDRRLVTHADEIVANSSYTVGRIRQIYGRHATVAPPGVDANRFQPETEKEPLVLSVGRLTPFKRFDIVLHAAAALKRSSIPVRWMIVGGGEERDTLHSLARKLSILDRIDFTGPRR